MPSSPSTTTPTPRRGPAAGRLVHPWAWWCWAIGVGVAVSFTANPLFLLLLSTALVFVVVWRRTDAPWAKAISAYFTMALFIIGLRLFFQILVGSNRDGHVLFRLPYVPLPDWVAGYRIGGPVTAEALLFSLYDSMRLAVMLLCVGVANALANPRRALRAVPAALYELSVAVTISLSVAAQLIESVQRVRRARRLRGGKATGWGAANAIIIPVLSDAIEASMQLAAGMEARGFGRTRKGGPNRLGSASLLLGATATTFGLYALLGVPDGLPFAVAALVTGVLLSFVGLWLGGRQLGVTRYRPDRWESPEWLVLGCGVAAAVCGVLLSTNEPLLLMSIGLVWPQLHPLMVMCAAFTLAPAFLTPIPPHRALRMDPA